MSEHFAVLIEVADPDYDPVVTESPVYLCHRADLLVRQTANVFIRIVPHVFLNKTGFQNGAASPALR